MDHSDCCCLFLCLYKCLIFIHKKVLYLFFIPIYNIPSNSSLFTFPRTGMAGVPGTAHAIFGAVKDVGANVIMISQVPRSSLFNFIVV